MEKTHGFGTLKKKKHRKDFSQHNSRAVQYWQEFHDPFAIKLLRKRRNLYLFDVYINWPWNKNI